MRDNETQVENREIAKSKRSVNTIRKNSEHTNPKQTEHSEPKHTMYANELSEDPETVYWGVLSHDNWNLYTAATRRGLCYITWPNESYDTMVRFIARFFPASTLKRSDERLEPYFLELQEYLKGTRTSFSIPLDLRGTPFQTAVWKALLQIPSGKTATYSDIAKFIGNGKAVRAVGSAIGANPIPIVVPCHRVLGKNGALTGFRGGLTMKSALLTLEGCTFPESQGK